MQGAGSNILKHLDPGALARIGSLELRARMVVEGYFTGMHHSPHHGVSIEFADHRAYVQGDDLRYIDWKVFGRTDKHYIKEYEQESNLSLMLVVDASESMNYRSRADGMSKYEYATTMAGSIAYLALQQQDSVGLAIFAEKLTPFIRPSNSTQQWKIILHELSQRSGAAKTSVDRMFNELAERLTQRTLIIIMSDLLVDPQQVIKGMQKLRYHRHEPMVWHVLDEAELTFPFDGPMKFVGMEDSGTLLVDARALRPRYIQEMQRFQDDLRSACGKARVDYAVFNTAQSLGVTLAAFLGTRAARLRQRSSRSLGAS